MDCQTLSLWRDASRALGPELFDLGKPMGNFVTEQPIHGVLFGPELVAETVRAEEGNVGGLVFDRPTFPRDPDIEIQEAWGMCQSCHDLALDGNRMLANLSIECFAEHHNVIGAFLR